MLTFLFLNQTLWCDPHWNRLSETIPMSGHTIGFCWEIKELAFRKLSILDLICCPAFRDYKISLLLSARVGASLRKNDVYFYWHLHKQCHSFGGNCTSWNSNDVISNEIRCLYRVQAVWHSDNISPTLRNIEALWLLNQTRNLAYLNSSNMLRLNG